MDTFANFIAGEWRTSDQTSRNINPSDLDDVIGEYAVASPADANDAISAASAAADAWRHATPQQRFDALDFIASEILARKEELGDLLAREEGKTRPEGIGEAGRAGQIFKFFAGEALRGGGDVLPSVRPGVKVEITREPVGVVGAITPWNFPIAIPAWKIAPALAYGNCVVFKPAGLVPGSAWALSEIISRSGLPNGVFNLVMGSGGVVGEALLKSDKVNAVTFTGSVETGAHVLAATSARGAKAQLEMGGKNPLIVLDDADLDIAVDCAVQGAFYSTGQRCTASSRIIVTEGIADRFVEALAKATQALTVGDARDGSTQIGPLADASQLAKTEEYVALGQEEGAKLIAGGAPVAIEGRKGFFYAPALLDHATSAMRVAREEIFGPVATVQRVADYEAALAAANDTEFGLSAGICTQSLAKAEHFKANAQAGMVMVNLPTAGVDYHVPFGGRKASSFGPREQGSYAREFYTTVKTAYQRSA
ncbi:MAG: aldehyde dehydrogenase family protein [Erythrobacter sp.]|uniref:aldehyde dehydrogenase family protein n=1 Tax=Erythrobacter sp. TaxID=1042 RepID=UPI002634C292|nr:aldehyde dehydrogenase family protein [Erythrobacter sp.]MDJ0978140.1 aldehyde dehydrogenase family protein [Erythrobacter sp.]